MKMISRSSLFKSMTALCLTMPLALSPAEAFTPSGNEVADTFLAFMEAGSAKVESYGAVEETGGTISLSDLVIKNEGDLKEARIASAELTDGEVQPDGQLKVGKLTVSGLNATAKDGALSMASITTTDLLLPKPEELKATDGKPVIRPAYRTVEANDIKITADETKTFTVGRLFIAIDKMDGDLPTASHFALERLVIDPQSLDASSSKSITDLGYDRLTLNLEGKGTWDPATETAEVSELKVSGEKAGTLVVGLSLAGITRDLVMQLEVLQDHPEQAMGLSQGVSIKSISIRFDNDTMAERILDMQARESGTDRATLVQQLTTALPMLVSFLQNPEFQKEITTAASAFLENPVSMTITATPAAPVPVSQILGQAMMAPQTLPQILGVNISANTPN